ncbi:MAG TPA: hypothetical protein VGR98_04880 [Streptosporangiaceae bacterium]|nr:hypothetical protein [Streptosporangiaceae bacterium]
MLTNERTPRRRPPGRRWPALALMLAAAAALSAACSSGSGAQAGPGNSPVASLAGHGGTATGAPQMPTTAQSDQDFVDFARCMRAHGVQMPDPFHRPGHAGLSIEVPQRDSATNAAWGACNHFIAKIEQIKGSHAAAQAAADLPALTRWAQCMRSHDIPMLDPTADGQLNLGNVPGIHSDFGRYSPQFRAADQACRHLLPAGVQDDGTGP